MSNKFLEVALNGNIVAKHRAGSVDDSSTFSALPKTGNKAERFGASKTPAKIYDSTLSCRSTTTCETIQACPSTTVCKSVQVCIGADALTKRGHQPLRAQRGLAKVSQHPTKTL
jgi:hypothetical protein